VPTRPAKRSGSPSASLSRTPTSNERKLVFVSGRGELPEELDGMYDRLAVESELHRQLRLRDGRWVT